MTSLFFFEIIKLADYEVGGLNYITPKLRTGIQKEALECLLSEKWSALYRFFSQINNGWS